MTKYVAIEGRGGSGKTYLSTLLGEKMSVKVFHLDDYGDDWKPFIGIPKLIELLTATTDDVVIFEGVGVFKDEFDQFNAYKIFVDTPEDIRDSRAKGRDIPRSDRTAEDWKDIWVIWNESDKTYYTAELRAKADLVVGSDSGEFAIDEIIASIHKNT